MLALLHESRERFLNSFAGISEEQSRMRTAPECWSVLDTVEHLTTAETIQLKLITTQRTPRPADAPNREQAFLQWLPIAAARWRRLNQRGQPGVLQHLAAAAEQFKKTRAGVIQFVEQNTPTEMRANEVKHPHPAAGMVSTFEMLIMMAKHAETARAAD